MALDDNDFLGSIAQENVIFNTQVVKTTSVGDNFWKVMVFLENTRYIDSTDTAWVAVPGLTGVKALTVTADDYASYTSGVLQSWLYDLFVNGFTGDCILVAISDNIDGTSITAADFITAMDSAYEILKPYAYFKTVLAGEPGDNYSTLPAVAVELASLCAVDKGLLSAAPLYPCISTNPAEEDDTSKPDSPVVKGDAVYKALNAANKDAFMVYAEDVTRNAALYSLGLALSVTNGSGTSVGNQFDFVASSGMSASGTSGLNPTSAMKTIWESLNIGYFKTVGDNSGNVAQVGAETLQGDTYAATWIIAYIAYMSKVSIAQLMTARNFYRNESNYERILNVLAGILNKFSERLKNIFITAPKFSEIAESSDEIIIPNAWEATYIDVIRKVTITGTLYIGG